MSPFRAPRCLAVEPHLIPDHLSCFCLGYALIKERGKERDEWLGLGSGYKPGAESGVHQRRGFSAELR
jgi:hypothetical protein